MQNEHVSVANTTYLCFINNHELAFWHRRLGGPSCLFIERFDPLRPIGRLEIRVDLHRINRKTSTSLSQLDAPERYQTLNGEQRSLSTTWLNSSFGATSHVAGYLSTVADHLVFGTDLIQHLPERKIVPTPERLQMLRLDGRLALERLERSYRQDARETITDGLKRKADWRKHVRKHLVLSRILLGRSITRVLVIHGRLFRFTLTRIGENTHLIVEMRDLRGRKMIWDRWTTIRRLGALKLGVLSLVSRISPTEEALLCSR